MTGWAWLILAGLLEICFTTFMKLSESFTKFIYFVPFAISAILSFGLLNMALKSIPMGTAYAVWTGIGAFGTAVVGILMFGESYDGRRLFFLALLIVAIIGLKIDMKA